MPIKLKDLKRGDWFTKKPIENPKDMQVWVKDYYDRSAKKYCCYKWGDMNHIQLINGNTKVYVDFTF